MGELYGEEDKQMVKITGEVPKGFFEWFSMAFNSKTTTEEEKELLALADIREVD